MLLRDSYAESIAITKLPNGSVAGREAGQQADSRESLAGSRCDDDGWPIVRTGRRHTAAGRADRDPGGELMADKGSYREHVDVEGTGDGPRMRTGREIDSEG